MRFDKIIGALVHQYIILTNKMNTENTVLFYHFTTITVLFGGLYSFTVFPLLS